MIASGSAAMLLTFDIAAEAIAEHDDWHTHEHMPERLGIPGFLRGSRWLARAGAPRYLVLYEVESIDVLASEPYLARLNDPSPWTARMMKHYVGMRRALCHVVAGSGTGMGGIALLIRFAPVEGAASRIKDWLLHTALPGLAGRRGIASAHLLVSTLASQMTVEQRIRGKDGGLHSALIITGYDAGAIAGLAANELQAGSFVAHGAHGAEYACGIYDHVYSLAYRSSDTLPSNSSFTPMPSSAQ